MYITIDESDRRPIYRQVADEIKGLIARSEGPCRCYLSGTLVGRNRGPKPFCLTRYISV